MSEQNQRLDPLATADSQDSITAEIEDLHATYRAGVDADSSTEETQPRLNFAPYRSSLLRHPTKDLHHTDPETIELASLPSGHRTFTS